MARPNALAEPLTEALAAIQVLQTQVAELLARPQHAPSGDSGTIVEGASFNSDPNKPLPVGIYAEPGTGLLRRISNGQVYNADADARPFTVRRLELVSDHKAEGEATLAAMRAGLEKGQIRTWDGLIRHEQSGKVISELMPQTYAPPSTSNSAPNPEPAASLPLSPAERDQAINDADQLALRDYDRRERAAVGAA